MKYYFCLILALCCVPTLWAYKVDTDSSGIYVVVWDPGNIPMQIKMPTSPTLADGTHYAGSVLAAMQAWNGLVGTVQFTAQTTNTVMNPPSGTYASGNSINEIVMDSQYNSGAERKDFDEMTLAIAVTYSQGNARVESDIVFNTNKSWNSYRGGLQSAMDIRRVAIHELGHTLGLGHTDNVPPRDAIMYFQVRDDSPDTMQADDIAGAQLLYGAPGAVPANDNFANAGVISLTSGSTQVTGTNIASTKQSGEPSHAGANAPSGHSVWWKWTAPGSGSTTIDTLGSNFDTALAVYTGSSVNALTTIASNDDAELTSQVLPDPTKRKRTSMVTFSAIGGTTYFIAVDGWGSTPGDQFTYTGTITLNLDFAASTSTAPAVTTQPTSQTVVAGAAVTFTAAANGNPAPTYQWKKGGVNIPGATGGSYTIASVVSGDAGNYTVVATNSAGSATSNAATLTVISAPTNAIISIGVE